MHEEIKKLFKEGVVKMEDDLTSVTPPETMTDETILRSAVGDSFVAFADQALKKKIHPTKGDLVNLGFKQLENENKLDEVERQIKAGSPDTASLEALKKLRDELLLEKIELEQGEGGLVEKEETAKDWHLLN